MSAQTGRVLRSKLGALKTRGYSFPLQSRLSGLLEHAAARAGSTVLGVGVEAIVTDSRVESLGRSSMASRPPACSSFSKAGPATRH